MRALFFQLYSVFVIFSAEMATRPNEIMIASAGENSLGTMVQNPVVISVTVNVVLSYI